jgi:hypothetical protein
VVLVGALHSMRFSVKKTALATPSSAAKGGSKGEGWEIDPREDPSAEGAALNRSSLCHWIFVQLSPIGELRQLFCPSTIVISAAYDWHCDCH